MRPLLPALLCVLALRFRACPDDHDGLLDTTNAGSERATPVDRNGGIDDEASTLGFKGPECSDECRVAITTL